MTGLKQLSAFGFALVVSSGCGSSQSTVGSAPPPPMVPKAVTSRQDSDVINVYGSKTSLDALKDLSPLSCGPGVFVCDPVSKDADPVSTRFGAGVGRWLNFTLGSNPAMERTQAWSTGLRVSQELGQSDLRVSQNRVQDVGRIAGVPYVLTGLISGTAQKCSLAYVLTSTETASVVGDPFRVSGALSEICASLPGLVKDITERVKVTPLSPTVPRADDLSFVGRISLDSSSPLTAEQIKQGIGICDRLPVVGLMMLDRPDFNQSGEGITLAKRLASALPDNPLVLTAVTRLQPEIQARLATDITALHDRYPNHYLLCRTQSRAEAQHGNRDQQLALSVRLVRIAPKSPIAWLNLGESLRDLAQDVRGGRVWAAMSDKDTAYVSTVYPKQEEMYARAVHLDPLYTDGWRGLAEAATFAGDESIADQAVWKALELDPTSGSTYSWGLQMYQPKWMDDPVKLRKVADLAAKRRFNDPYQTMQIGEALKGAGFPDKAKPHFVRAIGQYRAKVASSPRSAQLRMYLGRALWGSGRHDEARAQWQRAVALEPGTLAAADAQQALDYFRDM